MLGVGVSADSGSSCGAGEEGITRLGPCGDLAELAR